MDDRSIESYMYMYLHGSNKKKIMLSVVPQLTDHVQFIGIVLKLEIPL